MHLALLASLGRLGLSEHMWAEAADLTDLLRQGAGARGRSKRKEPKGVVHTQCKGRSTCKSGAYEWSRGRAEVLRRWVPESRHRVMVQRAGRG